LIQQKNLFEECGDPPNYAPFYAARAKFYMNNDTTKALADLQHAMNLDKNDWRYGKALVNYYFTQKRFDKALTIATDYNKKFPNNYLVGMLYVKALILNKQYEAANNILQTINILPNEGATDGRQLYEETQLMLALDEMKKKNYKQSLSYIHAAREWPENLGVGKPYESDIDERLEDWFAYQTYLKLKNEKAAQQMVDNIISFTDAKQNISPSSNDLITAWALQKKGNKEQGERFLQQQLEKNPNSELAQWTINTYKGKNFQLTNEASTNSNYKVLQHWIDIEYNIIY